MDVLETCGELYRELIKVNIDPIRADEMELWQIASLMTTNESSPDEISNRFLAERVRAAREGRQLDAESMITPQTDAEVNSILASRS